MLIVEESSCCEQLKADVIVEEFVVLEEGVHFLVVSVSEIALA